MYGINDDNSYEDDDESNDDAYTFAKTNRDDKIINISDMNN